MLEWRKSFNGKHISKTTYENYMKAFRDICDVIAARYFYEPIGGPGTIVEMDETFLRKWKYFRGRRTSGMSQTIFVITCRGDRSLYFLVDGKSKRDLWPLIATYVKYDTPVVCTDGGAQYQGLTIMFSAETEHQVTIHKNGEFVNKENKQNHINCTENENRYLKKDIASAKSKDIIESHMHTRNYFKIRLGHVGNDIGRRMDIFLHDMSMVFPGLAGKPLEWTEIENPTIESAGIAHPFNKLS